MIGIGLGEESFNWSLKRTVQNLLQLPLDQPHQKGRHSSLWFPTNVTFIAIITSQKQGFPTKGFTEVDSLFDRKRKFHTLASHISPRGL